MFPETEQQTVPQMMATESNYQSPCSTPVHGDEVLTFLPSLDAFTLYNVTSQPWASFFFLLRFHSKAGACARQPAAISLFFQLLVLKEVARRITLDDYKLVYSQNALLTDHFRPQTFATNTHALLAATGGVACQQVTILCFPVCR